MIGSFRFKPFGEHMLLTNDAGYFVFLSRTDFEQFMKGTILPSSEVMQDLTARYFCYQGADEVYYRNAEQAVRDNHAYLFSPTSLFIFALTNRCNNACVYCQANGGSSAHDMGLSTVRKTMERIAEAPTKNLSIEFQGGEPLLNLQAIQEIVRYAKVVLTQKKVEFSLVSNLMLIDPAMADFIAENKIAVSTSVDGPQWLHDMNRPAFDGHGSFAAMMRGKALLEERGVSVGAIETTTRASLPFAKDIVNTYVQLGFNSVFLRPLTRLGVAGQRWDEIGYTAEEFLTFYREGIRAVLEQNMNGQLFAERHAAIFLTKMFGGPSPNYMELRSPCGAGIGQLAITASGDVYTCDEGRMLAEMGDPAFRLGNVYQNGYNEWINSSVCHAVCSASLLETQPTCCDCVYQPYCGVCPVINYALDGELVSKQPHQFRCRIYQGMLDTLFEMMLKGDPKKISFLKEWTKVG